MAPWVSDKLRATTVSLWTPARYHPNGTAGSLYHGP
jgi:hypothetical protein